MCFASYVHIGSSQKTRQINTMWIRLMSFSGRTKIPHTHHQLLFLKFSVKPANLVVESYDPDIVVVVFDVWRSPTMRYLTRCHLSGTNHDTFYIWIVACPCCVCLSVEKDLLPACFIIYVSHICYVLLGVGKQRFYVDMLPSDISCLCMPSPPHTHTHYCCMRWQCPVILSKGALSSREGIIMHINPALLLMRWHTHRIYMGMHQAIHIMIYWYLILIWNRVSHMFWWKGGILREIYSTFGVGFRWRFWQFSMRNHRNISAALGKFMQWIRCICYLCLCSHCGGYARGHHWGELRHAQSMLQIMWVAHAGPFNSSAIIGRITSWPNKQREENKWFLYSLKTFRLFSSHRKADSQIWNCFEWFPGDMFDHCLSPTRHILNLSTRNFWNPWSRHWQYQQHHFFFKKQSIQ